VLNELKDKDDKLNFLLSIINKQFLDEDPKDLNFIVNLCYESQRHSIESSVKGWKRASKTDLIGNNLYTPPTPKGLDPPTPKQEEEEKDKEEEKEKQVIYTENDFLKRWKDARLYYDKKPTNITKLIQSEKVNFNYIVKNYTPKQIDEAISGLFFQDTYKSTRLRPTHFLELEHFEKYLTCFETKEKLFTNNIKKVERL